MRLANLGPGLFEQRIERQRVAAVAHRGEDVAAIQRLQQLVAVDPVGQPVAPAAQRAIDVRRDVRQLGLDQFRHGLGQPGDDHRPAAEAAELEIAAHRPHQAVEAVDRAADKVDIGKGADLVERGQLCLGMRQQRVDERREAGPMHGALIGRTGDAQ